LPIYWKLALIQQKQGQIIKEVLQHGRRIFDEVEFSLFKDRTITVLFLDTVKRALLLPSINYRVL
jgi:hypothetical protein